MLRSSFSSTVTGWSPAYAAALALVAIQVGIGIVYKIAQKGGRSVLPKMSSFQLSYDQSSDQRTVTHSPPHPPSPYPNSSNVPYQHFSFTENARGGMLRGVLHTMWHRPRRSVYRWKRRMTRGLSVRHLPWRREKTEARTTSRSHHHRVLVGEN